MHRITRIGFHQITDEELGPQIEWSHLKERLAYYDISVPLFCNDTHISIDDFRRFITGRGSPPSARARLRVAYHVAVLGIDDGTVVSEGKQPPTRKTKVG